MNDLLVLRGKADYRPYRGRGGPRKLPSSATVKSEDLLRCHGHLCDVIKYWTDTSKYLDKVLISVHYSRVIAKSNRVKELLRPSGESANGGIVGAKFAPGSAHHIITHYVDMEALVSSAKKLEKALKVLEKEFSGTIDDIVFNQSATFDGIDFDSYGLKKTSFRDILVDCHYVAKFTVELASDQLTSQSLITIFQTEKSFREIMELLGCSISQAAVIGNYTARLDPAQLQILLNRAPYLIAMSMTDFAKLTVEEVDPVAFAPVTLPAPSQEPVIGVIDTLFDNDVYFGEWVENHRMISENIEVTVADYFHGTAVSSIIVDGPRLNPYLEDGCGRFRVRHFGVALNKGFSSFAIVKAIKDIVDSNLDIKVWNISLGSDAEVHGSFISAEAALLDLIQFKREVVFIVCGTNKKTPKAKRIGAPADSINSIVVNSVDRGGNATDYTRTGPVLSFFIKPDVCYYGGTKQDPIKVCVPGGFAHVAGTSYAAPWIARKMAFMIEVLGLNREVAKALLVDSAIGWKDSSYVDKIQKGHGVVPINVADIVHSRDDEIKFIISWPAEQYETYNYQFPVPLVKEFYPFFAKATLCYFPRCSRNQGVDYTDTELDLYFGRLKPEKGAEYSIVPIDNNVQSIEDGEVHFVGEEEARKQFRKRDNVKHIQDHISARPRPRKSYEGKKLWGLSVKVKERLDAKSGEGLRFGVVITLKEMNGINRVPDFIQKCLQNGWRVDRISINVQVDLYNDSEARLDLEDEDNEREK